MTAPRRPNVFQSAWVVPEIESAIERWAAGAGVGPFFVGDFDNPYPKLEYRGKPGVMNQRTAWAQAGDTQIELIEPRGDQPNVYRDVIAEGETRFHHIGRWTDDFEADVAHLNAQGFETAMLQPEGPTRIAYLDSFATYGCMIELCERAILEGMFARIAEHCAAWDGTNPVRTLADL